MSHIVKTLFNRELHGSVPKTKTNLNVRMRIDDIIPQMALLNGHIILGFTECTRYIISYTVRPTTTMSNNRFSRSPSSNSTLLLLEDYYTYKLYFWSFVPFRIAKKVASFILFQNSSVQDSNLSLQICFLGEWVVVVGRGTTTENNTIRCHITILSLPTPHTTPPTISTHVDLLPPYPHFNPQSSLTLTDKIPSLLLNTGNLLLTLNFSHTPQKTTLKATYTPSLTLKTHYKRKLQKKQTKNKFFNKNRTQKPTLTPTNTNSTSIYDNLSEEQNISENYKTFRRRRLADKKYEFTEDDPTTPNHHHQMHKRPKKTPKKLIKCLSTSTRTYNEEDNESSTTQEDFEILLPLAIKTTTPLTITQISLDIEILSNEICSMICKDCNIIFNYLIDFSCNVLETLNYNVICYVNLLLKGASSDSVSSKYETGFVFLWDKMCKCEFYYEKVLNLVEVDVIEEEEVFQRDRSGGAVYVLRNLDLVREFVSVDELVDPYGVVTLFSCFSCE